MPDDLKTIHLNEQEARMVFDLLEPLTQTNATFKSDKEELEWYRRSGLMLRMKNHFGWRPRKKSGQTDTPPLGDEMG